MIKHQLHSRLDHLIKNVDAQLKETHKSLPGTRRLPTLEDLFTMIDQACKVMGLSTAAVDEIDIDFYIHDDAWKNVYVVVLGEPAECCVFFDHQYQFFGITYTQNYRGEER